MSKVIETLEKVTGLKRKDMDEIFQQVKANHKLLESCPRHDFSIALDHFTKKPLEVATTFSDWRCSNCGGWVDGAAKRWYERGLAHAKV